MKECIRRRREADFSNDIREKPKTAEPTVHCIPDDLELSSEHRALFTKL